MNVVAKVLVDSFRLLKKEPKLFLPKLLIAFLYGLGMLFTAALFKELLPALNPYSSSISPLLLNAVLLQSVLLLAFLFLVMILDVLFNAAYSAMLEDFFKKRSPSILNAFKTALSKFFVIVPAAILSLLVFLLLSLPFVFLASLALLENNFNLFFLTAFIVLVLNLLVTIAFYSLYPVSIFERRNFFGVLKSSAFISKRKFSEVFQLSLFSLFISAFGILFAFLAQRIEFLLLFVAFRLLTAILATYQIVLNPVFYLEVVKGK